MSSPFDDAQQGEWAANIPTMPQGTVEALINSKLESTSGPNLQKHVVYTSIFASYGCALLVLTVVVGLIWSVVAFITAK